MTVSELIPLLKELNSPVGWIISFVLFVVPVMLNVARKIITFHNDNIRNYRTKNFDSALENLDPTSVEYQLLNECKAQELVFLNSRLRLSKLEREQILQWMMEKAVTAELIRKAWSSVKVEHGRLSAKVTLFDTVFMWYLLFSASIFFLLGSYCLLVIIGLVMKTGDIWYLWPSAVFYLYGFFILWQCYPILYGRRLEYRLYQ